MVCLFVGLFDFWLILWCVHVVVVVVGGVRLRWWVCVRLRWWVCVWLVVVGLCVVGGRDYGLRRERVKGREGM